MNATTSGLEGPIPSRDEAIEAAILHLRTALPLLDLAEEARAAIAVSHALALVERTTDADADDIDLLAATAAATNKCTGPAPAR